MLDGAHAFVALRDLVLDVDFLLGNLDGESHLVFVEFGVVDFENVIHDLAFEGADVFLERVDVLLVEVLEVECVDLLLDEEDLNELGEFALEGVEEGEDGVDVFLEEVEVRVVAHLVVARVLLELVVLGSV